MVLRFAIDSIINNLRQSLITILILIISAGLIIFSTMIGYGHNYAYTSLDELLTSGAENTAIIRVENDDYYYDFMNELSRKSEISSVGSFNTYGITPIPELYEIQEKYKKDLDGCLEVIEVNSTASKLCELNLTKGDLPEKMDYSPQNGKSVEYMYLGSYFSEIPIGTEYVIDDTIFIVAGILDNSQRWIMDDAIIDEMNINTMDFTKDCKSSILSFYEGFPCTGDMYVCASDGYNIDQIIEIVYETAEKYDMDVRYTTVKTAYERGSENWIIINSILSKLIVIICFSCVLILLCFQLYRLLIMKKEMGIMLSVGFSISEIRYSMILSNIILSFISFGITMLISLYVVKIWFPTNNIMEVVNNVLLRYSYPISFAVVVGITAVTSIILTILLKKMSPIDMIGGQND